MDEKQFTEATDEIEPDESGQDQDVQTLVNDEATPTEYDAGVVQRIPAIVSLEEGRAEVTLLYNPNAQGKSFDEHLAEYSRRSKPPASDDEDADVSETSGQALLDAACWLFDTVIQDVEGIGEAGEEKPIEWRSMIFAPEHKKAVVEQSILFALPLQPKPLATRPSWKSTFGRSTTRLLCHFDGQEIETSHTMRHADNKTLQEFRTIWAKGGTGLELAALYETLKGEGKGYRGGTIPTHHKAAAVIGHCLVQDRVLGKK